jgi:hypothetical protein
MGFVKVKCEASIWVYQRDGVRIILPCFVDDMLLVSKSTAAIAKVKEELKAAFKLRDLGAASFFLGVLLERERSKRQIHLSQRQYILDILERYGFAGIKPVTTPLNPSHRLTKASSPSTEEEAQKMRFVPYAQVIGALLYLAISTRPDIAYAVGVLARFNSNPGLEHWAAVKHLLAYLKGTLDFKLTYGPDASTEELFTTYSDADHGGCKDTGRSTGAYVVKMGTGVISWSSKLQTLVALSTTEAEYIAAVTAGQEILWLRNLFSELGFAMDKPSTLYIDNQSAISVAKDPEHHGRMKHLDLRYFWLRDAVQEGKIQVTHCPTDKMPADLLTKALERVKVSACVEMLGLRCW